MVSSGEYRHPVGQGEKMRIENTPVRIGSIHLGVKTVPRIEEKNGSYTLLSGQGAVAILLTAIVALSRARGII